MRTVILPFSCHLRTVHFLATGCATAQSENLIGKSVVVQFQDYLKSWHALCRSRERLVKEFIDHSSDKDKSLARLLLGYKAIKRRLSEQMKI